MSTIIKTFVIVALAGMSTACTNFNRPSVDATEVIERSTVPQERAEIGDIQYVNLCVHKECDATRLKYTRAFRDAAVLTRAIEELDRYSLEAVAGADDDALANSSVEMPSLKLELERVRATLDAMDPGADFDTVELQIVTRRALIDARQQTDAASNALRRAQNNIERVLGEDPFMLVKWSPAPMAPAQPEPVTDWSQVWAKAGHEASTPLGCWPRWSAADVDLVSYETDIEERPARRAQLYVLD